jgi:NADH dehydrogenase [ubiquinone] 1 alpha subcomplex assembly factor 1
MIASRSDPICVIATLVGICFDFTMTASGSPKSILFDFSTTTNAPAWQIVNDEVMGGISTSHFDLVNGVAIFRGDVSLENSGGFASVRSQPARHDLTGCDTFVLRARGDGRRYKFTVRTGTDFDAPLYQCAFATKPGAWAEHRLPIKDFVPTFRGRLLTDVPPLDAARVRSVGFLISDRQAGAFRLEIASIAATRGGTSRL